MEVFNYIAWAISIALLAWMVIDALRVETTYDRDVLVSSVEGEIEKEILFDERDVDAVDAAQAAKPDTGEA